MRRLKTKNAAPSSVCCTKLFNRPPLSSLSAGRSQPTTAYSRERQIFQKIAICHISADDQGWEDVVEEEVFTYSPDTNKTPSPKYKCAQLKAKLLAQARRKFIDTERSQDEAITLTRKIQEYEKQLKESTENEKLLRKQNKKQQELIDKLLHSAEEERGNTAPLAKAPLQCDCKLTILRMEDEVKQHTETIRSMKKKLKAKDQEMTEMVAKYIKMDDVGEEERRKKKEKDERIMNTLTRVEDLQKELQVHISALEEACKLATRVPRAHRHFSTNYNRKSVSPCKDPNQERCPTCHVPVLNLRTHMRRQHTLAKAGKCPLDTEYFVYRKNPKLCDYTFNMQTASNFKDHLHTHVEVRIEKTAKTVVITPIGPISDEKMRKAWKEIFPQKKF